MTAKHNYRACRDDSCELPYCQIWKEAFAEGHELGFAEGTAAGYEAGYAAGAASCSCGGG